MLRANAPLRRAILTSRGKPPTMRDLPATLSTPKTADMPAWDLSALYSSAGSPEFARDMETAQGEAARFAEAHSGKLAEILSTQGGAGLAAVVRDYEAMQDRVGRLGSFAYLNYVTNTADAARAKFFGDVQEKLTAIGSLLLFFTLELNRSTAPPWKRAWPIRRWTITAPG